MGERNEHLAPVRVEWLRGDVLRQLAAVPGESEAAAKCRTVLALINEHQAAPPEGECAAVDRVVLAQRAALEEAREAMRPFARREFGIEDWKRFDAAFAAIDRLLSAGGEVE